MRILIVLWICLSFSVSLAQEPRLTETYSDFGVTIYHPADTFILTGQDIGVYFSQAPDVIVINTPRTLLDQWGIATPNLHAAMDAYAQIVMPSYSPAELDADDYLSATIGDYDALFVDLFDESTRSRIISYMVAIEYGYFSFTLHTQHEGDELAYRVRTLHSIIKTIEISPYAMPINLLPRTAPIVDIDLPQMVEIDSFRLFIPADWLVYPQEYELVIDPFFDPAATLVFFSGFSGYVFQTLSNFGYTETPNPIFLYDNLPYEVYYYADDLINHVIGVEFEGTFPLILWVTTENFDWYEPILIAIINTLSYTP